jgi:hypothetical protein
MTNDEREDSSSLDAADLVLADEVLAWANPNPERVGCPPADVLAELAARRRPPDAAAYEHLAMCSPCYRAVRALQKQGR